MAVAASLSFSLSLPLSLSPSTTELAIFCNDSEFVFPFLEYRSWYHSNVCIQALELALNDLTVGAEVFMLALTAQEGWIGNDAKHENVRQRLSERCAQH